MRRGSALEMNRFTAPTPAKSHRQARPTVQAAVAVIVALTLAACGGSSQPADQTGQAATCLRNALANKALGGGTSCADGSAAHVLSQGSGTRVTVTCTHSNGSRYICDVKVPDADGINLTGVHAGFYDVTYDGKSIVYQQTQ